MIIVIVHHWCKQGMEGEAIARVDGNGDAMAPLPGFMFRYRMSSPDDPSKLSTVTGWRDEKDYQGWLAHKRELERGQVAPAMYERVENTVHRVDREHEVPAGAAR